MLTRDTFATRPVVGCRISWTTRRHISTTCPRVSASRAYHRPPMRRTVHWNASAGRRSRSGSQGGRLQSQAGIRTSARGACLAERSVPQHVVRAVRRSRSRPSPRRVRPGEQTTHRAYTCLWDARMTMEGISWISDWSAWAGAVAPPNGRGYPPSADRLRRARPPSDRGRRMALQQMRPAPPPLAVGTSGRDAPRSWARVRAPAV